MDRTVATFFKNSREQVHVLLRNYKGRDLVDLRVFWTREGQEWHPSKKGLALGVEKLPVLLAALHKAAELVGEADPPTELAEDDLLTEGERRQLAKLFQLSPDQVDGSILE